MTKFSDTTGSTWITKEKLELMLVEKIMDKEYTHFVNALDRLIALPYSYRSKELIDKYRKPLLQQMTQQKIPEVQYDEKGRAFVTTYGELNFIKKIYNFASKMIQILSFRMSSKTGTRRCHNNKSWHGRY